MRKIFCLFMICFTLAAFSGCGDKKTKTVNNTTETVKTDFEALDNKRTGWGFRRTPEGPEFTSSQKTIMEKYGCIYMESGKEKNLYLTFDEGYENGYTSVILDVLRSRGVKAAFFVTGAYVKDHPELIVRMAKEGHTVGNHTVNHPSMPTVGVEKMAEEITELDRLVYDLTKKHCTYFRPPMGEYSERSLAVTKSLGYTSVFWSFAYVDWKNDVSSAQAEKSVCDGLYPGTVLLLHAVSEGNASALGNIIDRAHELGYEFKSLDEYGM